MDTDSNPASDSRTTEEFKRWSIAHKRLAEAVCLAKAFAQIQRERVDAYVLPIFRSFEFSDDAGERILSPNDLYLCKDEEMCKTYYAKCDEAHRANGFKGPEGHCPALTAENLLIDAEHALLEAGCEFLGVETVPACGDIRKQMLELLLKACISVPVSGGTSR